MKSGTHRDVVPDFFVRVGSEAVKREGKSAELANRKLLLDFCVY